MVVYTLEQCFAKWACDRLTEDADFGEKNHLYSWSLFWSWRVCKQAKLSHLGHRKPARIYWKARAPKTSQYLVRILVQRHNWAIFLRKWAKRGVTVNCDRYRAMLNEFLFTKIEEDDIGNIWFQQHCATCHTAKLHSMFCALFLKIVLSAAELMSFGQIGASIWHRWVIICGVPSKISVTLTSQRQLTL